MLDPSHAHTVDEPLAVLFDAYGTLFDVYSVGQLAEQLFPGRGQDLSMLWRDKQIEYSRLVTTSNNGTHYRPFSELTRAALVYVIKTIASISELERTKPGFDDEISQLMNAYHHLSAFAEVDTVLQALRARRVVTGILSNGDPGMLDSAVYSAGLEGLLDYVISVDSVRKYKTHPEAYALGEQATGLKAAKILFVSSNSWDALGATWHGYQTLWVNRYQRPFEELGTSPTRIGTSLHDVLSFF